VRCRSSVVTSLGSRNTWVSSGIRSRISASISVHTSWTRRWWSQSRPAATRHSQPHSLRALVPRPTITCPNVQVRSATARSDRRRPAGRRVFSPPRRKDAAAPHSAHLCGKSRRHPTGRKLVRRIGHMLHNPGYGPPFRRRRVRSMREPNRYYAPRPSEKGTP
jgi:hypothetical protein